MDTNNASQPQPQIGHAKAPLPPTKGGGFLKVVGWCVVGLVILVGVANAVLPSTSSSAASGSPTSISRSASDAAVTATYTASSAALATVIANTGRAAATPEPTAAAQVKEPTATPLPPTPTPKPKLGDAIGDKNWQVRPIAAKRIGSNMVWSRVGNVEKASGEWLMVTVEITNTTGATAKLGTWDLELKLADGRVIKPASSYASAKYGQLSNSDFASLSDDIAPGLSRTVMLGFDIPRGFQGIDFVYVWNRSQTANIA